MKTIYIFVLFVMQFYITTAQPLKEFNGSFGKGKASYQYFEDQNYNRIYNGSFEYNYATGRVKGAFLNNLRNGAWSFTKFIKSTTFMKVKYLGYKAISKGIYVDGKMDGEWSFSQTQAETNKLLMKSTANFKNGVLTGSYYYSDTRKVEQSGYDHDVLVKGCFDDHGFFDGNWLIKYKKDNIQYEDIRKYKNGYLYFRVHRNSSNGNIIEKFDSTSFANLFFTNYDHVTKKATVRNIIYHIEYDSFRDQDVYNFEKSTLFWLCFEDARCETNPLFDRDIPSYESSEYKAKISIIKDSYYY